MSTTACEYKHIVYLQSAVVRSPCVLDHGHTENHKVFDLGECKFIEILPQPVPALRLSPGQWLLGILGWPVKGRR